jgi:hypothetical protein
MQRVPTYWPTLIEALGGKPTKAEAKVLAAAKAGRMEQLRLDGHRPDKPTAATRIRAGLIRFLILGGDEEHPVHPRGVNIRSAFITGKLDLEACETLLDLSLHACRFDTVPSFTDAHLGGLYLPGCHLPGLTAQRMRLEENLHLRALSRGDVRPPFQATGPVDIAGARITGQLSCVGGRFDGAGRQALNADAMKVGADVFLSGGFHATGKVNLIGAAIAGQLACDGGRFDGVGGEALNGDAITVGASVFLRGGFHATGEVNFTRAIITGNLRVMSARIEGLLELGSARVGEGLFLTDVSGVGFDGPWFQGKSPPTAPAEESRLFIDLTESEAGVLADDVASWTQVRAVRLSGFRYRSVQSKMPLPKRLELFRRATGGKRFDPGPFTQHAKVLRQAGHRVDAGRVLFLRERLLRKAERSEAWNRGGKWRLLALLMILRDRLFQGSFGFGYRPAFALIWSILIISFSTLFFADVYRVGQFAPNSDVILNSTHWLAAVEQSEVLKEKGYNVPAQHLWTGLTGVMPPMPPSIDYETFGPFLYSVDLFLPLDTIGQTEAWAPSKDRGWWGWIGYYARMPIQLAGWVITALFAAFLTGLIGKRDD